MHWKEDILQGNIRENKGRKTSTEDTTCVESALGLGLDPHGAAFGLPVFTQELERSKPWACNRKQLGKERNITRCHTVVKVQSLKAIKVGTLQTRQHLELLGQPEFSEGYFISHIHPAHQSCQQLWSGLSYLECLTFKNSPPEKSHLSFAQFKPTPVEPGEIHTVTEGNWCSDVRMLSEVSSTVKAAQSS